MAKNQGKMNGRPTRSRPPKKRSVQFPKGTIDEALERVGLMDIEAMEALGVSSSTWFRWKRNDAIPVNQLYEVSTLLGLPEPATDDDIPRTPWFVMRTLEQFDARLARLEAHLLKEAGGRRPPRSS